MGRGEGGGDQQRRGKRWGQLREGMREGEGRAFGQSWRNVGGGWVQVRFCAFSRFLFFKNFFASYFERSLAEPVCSDRSVISLV